MKRKTKYEIRAQLAGLPPGTSLFQDRIFWPEPSSKFGDPVYHLYLVGIHRWLVHRPDQQLVGEAPTLDQAEALAQRDFDARLAAHNEPQQQIEDQTNA
jgi:hypothetical protein